MSFWKRFSVFVIGLAMLGIVAVAIVFARVDSYLNQPLFVNEPVIYAVASGSHYRKVLDEWQQQGWIRGAWQSRLVGRVYPELVAIKVGTFQIQPNATLRESLALLSGGAEFQYQLTFVEGERFRDWRLKLLEAPGLKRTLGELSDAQVKEALAIESPSVEGWLYPDTYFYTQGSTDLELLQRAHDAMKAQLEFAWQQRDPDIPLKSEYEVLIMASIIEKETGVDDERPRISSVFENRLRLGMRLQTDPTVIYGLGDSYQGDIKRVHLRQKTAYNTYVIPALPPTPIAMPGVNSLMAAVKPEKSDYLYFVASGGGRHYFSRTLKEHNQAVRKYILGK
ncbi:endolytic transglycosylase MltG [Corallincola holothuriorum]|uniref:Endolytic murein transglycosylase n=1 Tax=Corallincola holothuriorum TaxID=2282215 RepID=A0A368NSW6_9GAMM|nr:endolytic transglycosylase MltG [Corallincola holothuriorum]RCU52569.1 endolytic transglycosylase MltG [Corallincola holothuriorum]